MTAEDIDRQVAHFAHDLEGLIAVDQATSDADTFNLARAFRETPEQGVTELLRFHATHAKHPGYARHVVLAAVAAYAMCIAVEIPTWALAGHLKAFHRLALACRVVGITSPSKEARHV